MTRSSGIPRSCTSCLIACESSDCIFGFLNLHRIVQSRFTNFSEGEPALLLAPFQPEGAFLHPINDAAEPIRLRSGEYPHAPAQKDRILRRAPDCPLDARGADFETHVLKSLDGLQPRQQKARDLRAVVDARTFASTLRHSFAATLRHSFAATLRHSVLSVDYHADASDALQ